MARFWYTTADRPGERRVLEAGSLPGALFHLRQQALTVTGAGEVRPSSVYLPRVNELHLTTMYEQLAALLGQGVELSDALRRLAAETPSERVGRCLGFLAERVGQGSRLSEAMAEQPQIFAGVVISTVAAGEAGGDLTASLRSLADHQRDLLRLGTDLALPFAYPLFLLVIAGSMLFLSTLFLSVFILPKFVDLFKQLGMKEDEFPIMTRMLMNFSEFIIHYGLMLLVVLVGLVVFWLLRRRVRRERIMGVQLGPGGFVIPLVGRIAVSAALARTAATLRLLLEAHVPVPEAVRLAGEASGNVNVRVAMRRAQEALAQGGTLAESLGATALLPESFVFSLAAAEAGGTLPPTLVEMETDYRRSVGLLSRYWVYLAGPICVVVLGVFVLFVGIALWMPLIGVIGKLSS
jgi:type II secretory pathway component PulF